MAVDTNRYLLIRGGYITLFAYISLIPFYNLQPIGFAVDTSTVTVFKYVPVLFIGYITLTTVGLCGVSSLLNLRTVPRSLSVFLIFYLLLCVLSVFSAAEFFGIGIAKFIYYTFTGVFLFFLAYAQCVSEHGLYSIVRWVIGISSIVALYGITVYLLDRDYLWGEVNNAYNPYYSGTYRIGSTLGNPVVAGSYLALCLPYSFWAFGALSPFMTKQRIAYKACAGVMLMGLWLTFSRGAWVAAGFSCLVYLYPRYLKHILGVERLVTCLVVALLLVPLIGAVGGYGGYRVWERSRVRMEQTLDMAQTEAFRFAQYKTTWGILQEYPLLGIGFGNFTRLFDKYKDPSTPESLETENSAQTTENMYLMVACETGIMGLVTFGLLLFTLGRLMYRRYKMASPGPEREFYRATLASFCGFLLNMMTWDAFNQPAVRMTFWLIMGVALNPLLPDASRNAIETERK